MCVSSSPIDEELSLISHLYLKSSLLSPVALRSVSPISLYPPWPPFLALLHYLLVCLIGLCLSWRDSISALSSKPHHLADGSEP